jgi:hypothetical protein
MATKVIVLIEDRKDSSHGGITVLEDAAEGERLVETLLETGFEQDRIRVFFGEEIEPKITHKPVVELDVAESGVEVSANGADKAKA